MTTVRIIPCLDCKNGTVVKGVRFANLREAGSPSELAARYEQQGADEIVILDVAATPEGRAHQRETIRSVRAALSIPLSVGGGVRTLDDAGALLEAGADKVGINTAAFHNPKLLTQVATQFGVQCTVLALDAARAGDGWEVVITSGTERTGRSAIDWAQQAVEAGAGEILLTSWDRDGSKAGYDLELLRLMSRAVSVPIIASGGAAKPEHFVEAVDAGADAVLAASVFHFGEYTVSDIKNTLRQYGKEVRL